MLIKVHVWSHRNLLVTFSYGIPLARVCIRSASCLSGIVRGFCALVIKDSLQEDLFLMLKNGPGSHITSDIAQFLIIHWISIEHTDAWGNAVLQDAEAPQEV